MLQVKIGKKDAGKLLRQYLRDSLRLSSRYIKRLTREKRFLLINDQPVTVRYQLKEADTLTIKFPEETRSQTMVAERVALDIVYEDDWLIVLNKKAKIPSIPSREHPTGTIANGLLHYYEEKGIPYTVHIVTRLDKDTSGLMLVAKHQLSHSILSQKQRERKIERFYEALVEGVVKSDHGTINRPIRRKKTSIIEREVAPDGQEAITHYEVKRRYRKFTHVNIQLETGRTHQIRVHFSSIGHPLIGDGLYGNSDSVLTHHALHCHTLKFHHPHTNELLTFHVDVPKTWLPFFSYGG